MARNRRLRKKGPYRGFVGGTALFQKRAAQALPILVRQVEAMEPLSYEALAAEMDMPFPLNLKDVLGAIGYELVALGKKWREKIPPLQCLVVGKRTGIPSRGIAWFVPDREVFLKGTPQQKRQIVDAMLADVYAFRRWDDVLAAFGLKARRERPKEAPPLPPPMEGGFGGGESEDHRLLKTYVAAHPELLDLPEKSAKGQIEFGLPSADCIDVLFKNGEAWVGAEVKGVLSSEADIVRGMFQCVKYRALMEATQKYEREAVNARVVLVLGKPLPASLVWVKNVFGTEIVEDVRFSGKLKESAVSVDN